MTAKIMDKFTSSKIYEEIKLGKRRVVGYGASGVLPIILLQSPFKYDCIIDSNASIEEDLKIFDINLARPDVLSSYDPDKTAVAVLANINQFGEEIAKTVSRFGKFPLIRPYDIARDSPISFESKYSSLLERIRWRRSLINYFQQKRTNIFTDYESKRAVLWITQIVKGGAERQIALLAVGLRKLGWEIDLITSAPHGERVDTLLYALRESNVTLRLLPSPREMWPKYYGNTEERLFAEELSVFFSPYHVHCIVNTFDVLRSIKPQLCISYLDSGNVVCGVSAVLAGVPNILMSGRNVNPTNICFDDENLWRYPDVYRALLRLPNVKLSNNSQSGAESYAKWLRIPDAKIEVIRNAAEPLLEDRRDIRAELNISKSAPVLLGVMRLVEQKTPEAFVEIVRSVHAFLPEVRAILVGDGPLRGTVEEQCKSVGLCGVLHVVGAQDNPRPFYEAANIVFMTSKFEGMSNVALEAQMYGIPVVSTDVVGMRDALAPCFHPHLKPYGRWEELAREGVDILVNKDHAEKLSKAGRDFVAEQFSVEMLAKKTLAALDLC